MNAEQLRDLLRSKPAMVVGLGITGIETALFLKRCGLSAMCIERSSEDEYRAKSLFAKRLFELQAADIPFTFGVDGDAVKGFTDRCGIAILSPGISLTSPTVSLLKAVSMPFISELELGLILSGLPYIMVTGSNGKTTTVNLISSILSTAGMPNFLCGNVGTPLLSQFTREDLERGSLAGYRYLVVEASSYQLESTVTVKPKVGIFLNISENHLERHGSMERYLDAKLRMLTNQSDDDLALINYHDGLVRNAARGLTGKVGYFGAGCKIGEFYANIVFRPNNRDDYIRVGISGPEEYYELRGAPLLGLHNRYNIAASILAARYVGVPIEAVVETVMRFAPLPHRIEPILGNDQLIYINDSKSTTVASTVAALSAVTESYPDSKIVLLIGGQAKAGSWDPLIAQLKDLKGSLRGVLCFGKDRTLLKSQCDSGQVDATEAAKLEDAYYAARKIAKDGDLVLLSPGCASFDQFKSFEERGELFRRLVTT